jgi:arylamine N-acetyltransferase
MYHVLDRWGLPGQSPAGALRLESLHAAWLHHVPFENVSKLILSRGGRPEARRRSIRRFWIDHFRWGAGGTCFDLTASFAHLLTFAGFEPRFVFCRLPGRSERSHVALLVRAPADAKEEKDEVVHLVDVGFALPCPVPIPKGLVIRRSTRYYDIEVRRGVEG